VAGITANPLEIVKYKVDGNDVERADKAITTGDVNVDGKTTTVGTET
jgi:hypothetical protein